MNKSKDNNREKLFSVTKDDFRWDYYRGTGNGGQHRNKRDTACRCTHIESGAVGCAQDHREQKQNRELAFQRCVETKRFQVWLKMEIARRSGEKSLEEQVEEMVRPRNLKVECRDETGKWIIYDEVHQERETDSTGERN